MDLQERYRKHKTFIENRWQPIDVKVILEEDPGKKISIIREEKRELQMRFRTKMNYTHSWNT